VAASMGHARAAVQPHGKPKLGTNVASAGGGGSR